MKFLNNTAAIFLFTLFFIAGINSAQNTKPLFENEVKFCRTLTDSGLSNAFLKFIAEDAIIFAPKPVGGKNYYEKNKNDAKTLIWEAEFAEMSANNDFGYTTGPWHSTKLSKNGKEVATYGHFNTVWQKIDGEWKFLIDCGISYDKKEIKKINATEETLKPVTAAVLKRERFAFEPLIKIDNEFCNIAFETGLSAAYEKYASENMRIYRDKKYPVIGLKNAKEIITGKKLSFMHMGGKAAPLGDFAFTYGIAGRNIDIPEYSYMKVWKKEGTEWKIVLDVMNEIK
jgi:ketosteroid isomerase-like protein